jgi:hypothetical protein
MRNGKIGYKMCSEVGFVGIYKSCHEVGCLGSHKKVKCRFHTLPNLT